MLLQRVITVAVLTVTICVAINATSLTEAEIEMRNEVLHGLRQFDETGKLTEQFIAIIKQLPLSTLFSMNSRTEIIKRDNIICSACIAVVNALTDYINTHSSEDLLSLISKLCIDVVKYDEEVCSGVISLNLDSALFIFKNTNDLTASRVCGIVLQDYECSKDDPSLEWTIQIPPGPAPEVNRIENVKADADDPLTIIQLSDIHHDPVYLPGGNAVCAAPMCCRNDQGTPANPGAAAGFWGDYRSCDLPWNVFKDTVQQIKRTHQNIDFIYVTGDIVDHSVWSTSITANSDVITKVMNELKEEFPDTPIYPILGNHEPSPLNVFAPHYITDETISTKWLYELIADLWSVWLPEEAKQTILHGGFYTALAKPGFRIIALNNNVCYTFNWWLIHSPKDQDDQLQWLADTLLQAEKEGEKVHILGHIPSGSSECIRTWSREFRKIIDRFENTVAAIFNGHTHNDHFHVYYSINEPTRPISVALNGGSVTQFSNLNSNYKTYSVDSDTFGILDSESWIFNLAEANKDVTVNPTWFKLYSFKDDYGVKSLSPEELHKLTHKLAGNSSLIQEYSRHYVKDAASGCDSGCLRNRLCYTATTEVGDYTQCDILLQEFESNNP